MSNLTKVIIGVVILTVIAVGYTFLRDSQDSDSTEVVKIGVTGGLTGDLARYGKWLQQGMDLAYGQLPIELQEKIEIDYQDDQFDNTKAVTNYQRFVSINKAKVVVAGGGSMANSLTPLAEKDHIVLIGVGTSRIPSDAKYTLRHFISPPVQTKPLADLIKQNNFEKVGFVTLQQDGALLTYESFLENLEVYSFTNVFDEKPLIGETDYRTLIAKIKSSDPDILVVNIFNSGVFMKQLRELGVDTPVYGWDEFESSAGVELAQGAMEGVVYTTSAASKPQFVADYREAYGVDPGTFSCNGYDIVKLVAETIQEHGTDEKKMNTYLHTVQDFDGACGTYDSLGDGSFSVPVEVKTIKNGQFVPYGL